MFFKPAFVAAAIATLAVATPAQRRTDTPSCSTGELSCCNSLQDAKSAAASKLLALVGVAVQDVTGLVGITCSPLSVIGLGSASCSAQTVCCDNTSFNGLINLGCSPINLSL